MEKHVRLAGAVRPKEADDFAAAHREAHVGDDVAPTVALAKTLGGEARGRAQSALRPISGCHFILTPPGWSERASTRPSFKS